MRDRVLSCAFGALGLVGVAASASGQTVYSQGPSTPAGFGFFSSTVPRVNRNYKHADDFTLAATATIDRVRWWGMSDFRFTGGLGNFSSFTVEVFTANAAGTVPGALVRSETFLPGQTAATATGRVAFDTGATEFRQEVVLGSPLELLEGVKYFLAVSARPVNGNGDSWMWQDGEFVNGRSALLSWASGGWSEFIDTDSAFELVAVPGPGVGGMVALVGGLGVVRRRR